MATITTCNPEPSAPAPHTHRSSPRFYPQLDGMRGIAVLLVLACHMDDLRLPAPLAYLASLGWIGVDAFFVLSGFLITNILLNCKPGFRSVGRFVLRRTLRTWPLYFVVLLVAYLTLRHHPAGAQINWLQHVVFLQNYIPAFIARSLGPTWSLCIEEHFYLLWPLLVFLLPRRHLAWVLAAIFCSLPLLRYWGLHHAFTYKQLYTETQFHLDGLVAGSLVALMVSWYRVPPRTMIRAAYACLVIGAGTAILGFWSNWSVITGHNVVFGFTSLAIAFAGLLIFLLHSDTSMLSRVFRAGPLLYCGRISYGIYLLHDGLIAFLRRFDLHRVLGSMADSSMVVILLRVALSIGVASLSYRFYEAPHPSPQGSPQVTEGGPPMPSSRAGTTRGGACFGP